MLLEGGVTKKDYSEYWTYLTFKETCSCLSIGSQLTKTFHWGRSKTIWAALVVSSQAELRSCLIESAHLVLGRPLGAKTINIFRACLGAQLTICAQK